MSQAFSLQDLAKIFGAEENKDILEFFNILMEKISDEEVKQLIGKKMENFRYTNLREDEENKFDYEKIQKCFPEQEDGYIVIPGMEI